MQIIAIDEIYRQMGLDLSQVIYIDTDDLSCYDGEYVVLPVGLPLLNYEEQGIAGMFSERIIPVFWGFTTVKEKFSSEEVSYLHRYEPIGARDERTLINLRRYGIQAFLNGCFTITLPFTSRERDGLSPYIVEVDESLHKFIPIDIKKNAIYRSHHQDPIGNPKQYTLNLYNEYKENAGLVITSLLHCALPCIAAGIPVVLLKKYEEISFRFAWLEKILPIYTEKSCLENSVDWYPKAVDIADIKRRVLSIDIAMLQRTYNYWSDFLTVSYFYENRQKHIYTIDMCDSIKEWIDANWTDTDFDYRYSFWGLTQISEWLDDYIKEKYPHAILCHVYDKYRCINFRNFTTEDPQHIIANLDEFVFVTAEGASRVALDFFAEIGKSPKTYAVTKTIF